MPKNGGRTKRHSGPRGNPAFGPSKASKQQPITRYFKSENCQNENKENQDQTPREVPPDETTCNGSSQGNLAQQKPRSGPDSGTSSHNNSPCKDNSQDNQRQREQAPKKTRKRRSSEFEANSPDKPQLQLNIKTGGKHRSRNPASNATGNTSPYNITSAKKCRSETDDDQGEADETGEPKVIILDKRSSTSEVKSETTDDENSDDNEESKGEPDKDYKPEEEEESQSYDYDSEYLAEDEEMLDEPDPELDYDDDDDDDDIVDDGDDDDDDESSEKSGEETDSEGQPYSDEENSDPDYDPKEISDSNGSWEDVVEDEIQPESKGREKERDDGDIEEKPNKEDTGASRNQLHSEGGNQTLIRQGAGSSVNCTTRNISGDVPNDEGETHGSGIGEENEEEEENAEAAVKVSDFNVIGNNNRAVNQGPGSSANFNNTTYNVNNTLKPKIEVVNQITQVIMPAETAIIFRQLLVASNTETNGEMARLQHENFQLKQYIASIGGDLHSIQQGSIILNICFKDKPSLERFWKTKLNGGLAKNLAKILITKETEERAGCKLGISIDCKEHDYRSVLMALDEAKFEERESSRANHDNLKETREDGGNKNDSVNELEDVSSDFSTSPKGRVLKLPSSDDSASEDESQDIKQARRRSRRPISSDSEDDSFENDNPEDETQPGEFKDPRPELTRHLLPLSQEQVNIPKMYKEWMFDHIVDLRAYDECNCGHYPIRYQYYFRNTVTGKLTFVGAICKTLFKSTPEEVSDTAKALIKRGLEGVRCVAKKPERVKFEFGRRSRLNTNKDVFKRFFGKIPYKIPRDRKRKPVVWISMPNDYVDKFEIGKLYDIRIKMMKSQHDNGLRLRMSRFKIRQEKTSALV